MGYKARALAALLLLLSARLATAAHSTASKTGDDLPPMNPPIVLKDDPSTPITYEWPSQGPWPPSDDDEALAKAFAADEAAYVLTDYPDEYDYSLLPVLTTGRWMTLHALCPLDCNMHPPKPGLTWSLSCSAAAAAASLASASASAAAASSSSRHACWSASC